MEWFESWKTNEDYVPEKLAVFQKLDEALKVKPQRMLEIGCGMAIEAEQFQKKYGTELYLLDGDSSVPGERAVNFGPADTMKFYSPVQKLQQEWDSRGLDYTFVDASKIDIPSEMKFDLIYSCKSYGFHYPLGAYEWILRDHSTSETQFVFDIRFDVGQEMEFDTKNVIMLDKDMKSALTRIEPVFS